MTVHEPSPTALAGPAGVTPRRGTAAFMREACRASREIGAIAPSGPRLAALAADQVIPDDGPQTVVELGPGSGALTDALQARLPPTATFLAVESNTAMVRLLAKTHPDLSVLHGDAADLPELLGIAGVGQVDLIVSALPWSRIPDPAQQRLLAAITRVLAPRGVLATVLTVPVLPLPRVRRLLGRLDQAFGSVTHRSVWANTPPARLYVCRHPQPSVSIPAQYQMGGLCRPETTLKEKTDR
jgi:phosphatidylethanolamine/phosphatidyl-N-methylethanolamine N-methyltransferase